MIKIKENTINKLNINRENINAKTGPIFLKEERGGKNHSKFRKVIAQNLDDDHIITDTGYKYYKSHIKRNKKHQDNYNPNIKAKTNKKTK